MTSRKARATPSLSPRPTAHATLAGQKSDFTAEGSPPPGKVANVAPVQVELPAPRPGGATVAPAAPPGRRGARPHGPRPSKARYP
ncbi:MAG: hypothetical protein JNN03_04480 [Rubrivivax sp.]|nr:hypothetical protein [Rubrivivax sp.]